MAETPKRTSGRDASRTPPPVRRTDRARRSIPSSDEIEDSDGEISGAKAPPTGRNLALGTPRLSSDPPAGPPPPMPVNLPPAAAKRPGGGPPPKRPVPAKAAPTILSHGGTGTVEVITSAPTTTADSTPNSAGHMVESSSHASEMPTLRVQLPSRLLFNVEIVIRGDVPHSD